jgi:hypothetical protein
VCQPRRQCMWPATATRGCTALMEAVQGEEDTRLLMQC